MGIIQRQSIQNTVITYFGIGLGFISTIYLYPVILNPDQYGLTRLLLSLAFIVSEFAHLGVKHITIKFFPIFQNKQENNNGFLFLVLLVPLVGFLIFLSFFFPFEQILIDYYQDGSTLFSSFYLFLLPLIFGVLYFDIINSYIRALYDSVPGSIINEVILRFFAILLLTLFAFELISFKLFMYGFVGSYLLQPLFLVLYLSWIGEFNLKPQFGFLNKGLIKDMSNYGFYILLGGVSHLIVNNIDIIMLGSLMGLTETAIYAVAFYIGSVIVVPQKSIGKIAPSLLSTHLQEDNLIEVEKIYKRSSLNQLVFGSFIYILILASVHNLIEILPPTYSEIGIVVLFIGIAKLIDMAAGVNGSIIVNSKFYRFNLIATVILVGFSVLFNYLLIPKYGIIGAAFATVLSLFLYNIIKGVYVWFRFSMQPFSYKTFLVVGICIIALAPNYFIPRLENIYLDTIIRSSTIAIVYVFLAYKWNVSFEANKILKSLFKRVFKPKSH